MKRAALQSSNWSGFSLVCTLELASGALLSPMNIVWYVNVTMRIRKIWRRMVKNISKLQIGPIPKNTGNIATLLVIPKYLQFCVLCDGFSIIYKRHACWKACSNRKSRDSKGNKFVDAREHFFGKTMMLSLWDPISECVLSFVVCSFHLFLNTAIYLLAFLRCSLGLSEQCLCTP